ncbi:MAG: sigma-70 family RNA polymerase sigma factor [Phycisphaerae bacterium]|nr:sigma-70 family RNA polymerase sigma factor [Phycisphaerae bacterium]
MPERPNKQTVLCNTGDLPSESPVQALRLEDAVLVERARGGDVEAFGLLVSKCQEKVYNMCWRMCGHVEDARDLTQEAFFRAYQSIASFQGRSGFYTWVFRIAMNLSLSHHRKARHRRTQSLDQETLSNDASEPLRSRISNGSAPQPADRLLADELQQQVEDALKALDPGHRAVIVLRDLEGFDYAKIAQILEIAPGTVKSRLHRARTALREQLKPYMGNTGRGMEN